MLLELEKVVKSFGGLMVLSQIDFHIDEGEIIGLIGPNGAGKTTLFNVITGIYRPEEGAIRYKGRDLVGLKPYQICRQGIARTFQLVRIFPSMTVLENVMVGSIYGNRCNKKQGKKEALRCLEILNLMDIKDTVTGHLTLSNRRLVEIARAMAANPGLALLDEPLAGLNPTETEKIMVLMREIRESHGISILWIEHKIDAVFDLCDRIVVIEYGRKLADGDPDSIANNKKVMEAYLGESPT
ncbi:MAG: ABC transporter ATP-binding protein [Desulfobacterales bacterium]|nr:ABC transporter ATP-binding protein [Desulfobacterales bacterium]